MNPEKLTIEAVERALDWPAEDWEGQCHAVACQLVEKGCVEGRAVYGAWYGDVSDKSEFWKHKQPHTFVRHSWVLLPDGRILDPTRWSFEGAEPYIWIGRDDDRDEYDEGNNRLAEAMMRPWPAFDDSQSDETFKFELLPEIVSELESGGMILDPLDPDISERDPLDFSHYVLELTTEQVFWLANFPLTRYSGKHHAREVYAQIIEHDRGAFIPMDNRVSVMGK